MCPDKLNWLFFSNVDVELDQTSLCLCFSNFEEEKSLSRALTSKRL